MTKANIPTDSAGLQELMADPARLKELFSASAVSNGDTKTFLDAYSAEYLKRNSDTQDDLRTQIQAELFSLVRNAGGGSATRASVVDGKPVLSPQDMTKVTRGRGAVYNSSSMGAQLENKWKENPEETINSIGEYCKAIFEMRSPSTRSDRQNLVDKLARVREFQNSFSSEDPGAGGFLIPELMRSDLLQLAIEQSIVRSRATVIPMSTLRVPIPTVDDTSHVSSLFGGVVFYWTEEAAQLVESQATFGKVVLDAKKLTGFFKVPAELLDDAPAFAGWFDSRVPLGLAWNEDVAFMTGVGAEQPQGFISCPASVQQATESGQATKTLVWENIVKMYSRMLPTSLSNAVWIASIDTFPELATMALSVGTGGGPVWIGGWSQPGSQLPPMNILGRPVIFTEKTGPLGTTGDLNFVDLSYYLIGDRQQVRVDSSEHFLFQNNQVAYRIIERVDGRPWIQSALTPHNGGPTISPFVQLASR